MSNVPDPIRESDDARDAIERARAFGIDISLLQSNLRLTPSERIMRLQSAVNSLHALRTAIAAGRAQSRATRVNEIDFLRGAPRDLSFRVDSATIRAGVNFSLDTNLGPLDLLGEVPPFGAYASVIPYTENVEIFGFSLRILSLDALMEAKRAAGRPKDQLILPELEALRALKQDKD